MNNQSNNNSRRKFIKATGAVAGVTVIPSKSVWGACNASGVSGGSQALENVCRVNESDDPSRYISLGGFAANEYVTVFTSLNSNRTPLPDASARGVVGAMIDKTYWLDEDSSLGKTFGFPVFRYLGNKNITNLINYTGIAKSSDVKSHLTSLDKADGNDLSEVSYDDIKGVLDPSIDWHINELFIVREKLMKLADIELVYVAGVSQDGKATTAELNVLDAIKTGSGAALQIAALYLNLAAGFCSGVPAGYSIKTYCEHLLSIILENATEYGFATDLITKVSGRFTAPSSISISSFLSK